MLWNSNKQDQALAAANHFAHNLGHERLGLVGCLLYLFVAYLYGNIEAAKVGDDTNTKGADATMVGYNHLGNGGHTYGIATQCAIHSIFGRSLEGGTLCAYIYTIGEADILLFGNLGSQLDELMIITDHINFMPENPLHGPNIPPGPRFPDMSEAYDTELIELADRIAAEQCIKVKHGVYLATQGPTYETPSEYRMFARFGADAVGMSTVPEVIVARHCGIRCFGISIITDLGVNGKIVKVTHENVQKAANEAQPRMAAIMREMISRS